VAQLAEGSGQKLETFTVTFPGSATDEESYARRVVDFVGSSPHYITPTPQQFLDDLDRLLWIHDEPVGSLAQYAAYALARLTREAGVPVTLNGQGGDEVLGGYWQSYFMHLRHLMRSGRLLSLGRHVAGSLLPGGNSELPRQAPMMLRRYRSRQQASANANRDSSRGGNASSTLQRLMDSSEQQRRVFEIRQMYLPRLLKWDDRNFMAFAVEGRYPFLDHELIELALSFGPRALYARGWTKEPLRRGLRGVLPKSVLRRRTKFGFETPQDAWLRGALRPTLESWLKGDSPLWQYVEPGQARRLADAVWSGREGGEEQGQALMRLFLADRWLRVFFSGLPRPVS
jgi:asparagine synthase (glutamine-hydrolysing)